MKYLILASLLFTSAVANAGVITSAVVGGAAGAAAASATTSSSKKPAKTYNKMQISTTLLVCELNRRGECYFLPHEFYSPGVFVAKSGYSKIHSQFWVPCEDSIIDHCIVMEVSK